MTYKEWLNTFYKKRDEIIKKLDDFSIEEIVDYFVFENMVKNEPDFCPLYKEMKKCHDTKYLNCFYCACPYFIFDDNGLKKDGNIKIKSKCLISSKKSSKFIFANDQHCDCSKCIIPHTKNFVLKGIKKGLK